MKLNLAKMLSLWGTLLFMLSVETSLILIPQMIKDFCFSQLTRPLHRTSLLWFYVTLKLLKWIFTTKTHLIHTGLELEREKKTRLEEQKIGTICFLYQIYVDLYIYTHTYLECEYVHLCAPVYRQVFAYIYVSVHNRSIY